MARPTEVKTGKVRFGYPAVFVPTVSDLDDGTKSDPKYRLTIYIKKTDTATVEAVKTAIRAAHDLGIEKGKYPKATKCEASETFKYPLRDGDKKENGGPEYAGHYYINATANVDYKPGLVGRDPNHNITSPDEFYAGCYGRVTLNFFAYGPKPSKGISAGLMNIQKLSDGPRLDGSRSAVEDFDDDFLDTFVDDEDYEDYKAPAEYKKTNTKAEADDYDDL